MPRQALARRSSGAGWMAIPLLIISDSDGVPLWGTLGARSPPSRVSRILSSVRTLDFIGILSPSRVHGLCGICRRRTRNAQVNGCILARRDERGRENEWNEEGSSLRASTARKTVRSLWAASIRTLRCPRGGPGSGNWGAQNARPRITNTQRWARGSVLHGCRWLDTDDRRDGCARL
jgi:hypothetical protein